MAMDSFEKDRAAFDWIKGAWDDYLNGLPVLLPVLLALTAASAPALWLLHRYHSYIPAGAYMLLVLLPLQMGSNLVYINLARGTKAGFTDMFSAFPVYHRAMICALWLGCLTAGGVIVFVVPGIILYLTYGFTPYALVDKRSGVKGSFALSREITDGWRTRLFVIFSLTLAVNIFAPEVITVGGTLKAPALEFDFKAWTVVSSVLKAFVFVPWLDMAMARAYNFLLCPRPIPEPLPDDSPAPYDGD